LTAVEDLSVHNFAGGVTFFQSEISDRLLDKPVVPAPESDIQPSCRIQYENSDHSSSRHFDLSVSIARRAGLPHS
jgi:hypothetical protein